MVEEQSSCHALGVAFDLQVASCGSYKPAEILWNLNPRYEFMALEGHERGAEFQNFQRIYVSYCWFVKVREQQTYDN